MKIIKNFKLIKTSDIYDIDNFLIIKILFILINKFNDLRFIKNLYIYVLITIQNF